MEKTAPRPGKPVPDSEKVDTIQDRIETLGRIRKTRPDIYESLAAIAGVSIREEEHPLLKELSKPRDDQVDIDSTIETDI